jgi:hypothetical protein
MFTLSKGEEIMGMGSAPCSGYVLPANKDTLGNFRWDEKRLMELAKNHMEENDLPPSQWGEVNDFDDALCIIHDCSITLEIEVATIVGLPTIIKAELFRYDRDEMGDRYDDLEDDGYYLIFDEDNLYERTLSRVGQALKAKGILPELKQWTTFG